MKEWWSRRWYEALVVLVIGGIFLYIAIYANMGSMSGILIKTENDYMYLLRTDTAYESVGSVGLTATAKRIVNLEKYDTGDRVKIRGNIHVLETWPARYQGVRRIIIEKKYDEESLQIVRDQVQSWNEGFGSFDVVYPE